MKKLLLGLTLLGSMSSFADQNDYSCDAEGIKEYTAKIRTLTFAAASKLEGYQSDRTWEKVLEALDKNITRERKSLEKCLE